MKTCGMIWNESNEHEILKNTQTLNPKNLIFVQFTFMKISQNILGITFTQSGDRGFCYPIYNLHLIN